MGKLKVSYANDRIRFVNVLGKYERVNYEELKVLQNHGISRLLPTAVYSRWGRMYMEVKVRGVTPLQSYYSVLNAPATLNFIWETLETAMECERSGFRPEKLCWDPAHIFVEQNRGAVYMVYWPVVKLKCDDEDMVRFFSRLIPWLETGGLPFDVVNTYKAYFHQRQHMDMPRFYQLVRGMIEQLQQQAERLKDKEEQRQRDYKSQQFKRQAKPAYMVWLEKGSERIYLISEKTTIGRDKSVCDVTLHDDPGLSRCHATFENRGGSIYVMDLDSRNGVYVRGEKICPNQPVLLQNGDPIRISRSTYTIRIQKRNQTILIHQR